MPSVDSSDLARWLADTERHLGAAKGLQGTLDEVCRLAVAVVDGCRSAMISEEYAGRPGQILAASDDVARKLHAAQCATGGGPCLDASWRQRVSWCDDLSDVEGWQPFAAQAAKFGIRSCVTIQLYSHGDGTGLLTMYSDRLGAFDEVTRDVAQIFAAQAAPRLAGARENAELSRALTTRQRIGEATGILAERHGVTTARAFAMLAQTSQDHNVRVRDLAEDFVTAEDSARHTTQAAEMDL